MAYDDIPKLLRDFLFYLDVVTGKSKTTIYEYYLDLRNYFKYIKKLKYHLKDDISAINISDIEIEFIKEITLQDTYEYLYYMKQERSCNNRTVNRKICSVRMFFKYLCNKSGYIINNPVETLESNSLPRTLPKHLSLSECELLLGSTDGKNGRRDFAIITLFLNCGLRLSELVAINLSDLGEEYLVITGKGNKQRSIYLNDACKQAIEDYLKNERSYDNLTDDGRKALFLSIRGSRISRRMVQYVVENHLKKCGLGDKQYSTHKLRHTAATLMHKYGHVDVRVLQEVLGHENLGTTQIYTHIDTEQIKVAVNSNPVSKIKIKKKSNCAEN